MLSYMGPGTRLFAPRSGTYAIDHLIAHTMRCVTLKLHRGVVCPICMYQEVCRASGLQGKSLRSAAVAYHELW